MTKIFLVADDDRDDSELFQEALEIIDPSIICYTASEGEKAIEILDDNKLDRPHIIFLDINMPGMNGWECLKALKGNESYRDIPVLMYSTSSHQREAAIALGMGALCFISKPHNFEELKKMLQVIVEHLDDDLREAVRGLKGAAC